MFIRIRSLLPWAFSPWIQVRIALTLVRKSGGSRKATPVRMNFELKDIVDTAGATVGLVIATSIFMQLLTTKAIALFDRYRELTMEYRSTQEKPQRNENLRAQIGLYRRRCHLIQMALASLAYAEFIFLATILLSSASLIF